MPESLGHHARVRTNREQECRRGVPKIMEAHPRDPCAREEGTVRPAQEISRVDRSAALGAGLG